MKLIHLESNGKYIMWAYLGDDSIVGFDVKAVYESCSNTLRHGMQSVGTRTCNKVSRH